jgi:Ca2+/Na+ antiporter
MYIDIWHEIKAYVNNPVTAYLIMVVVVTALFIWSLVHEDCLKHIKHKRNILSFITLFIYTLLLRLLFTLQVKVILLVIIVAVYIAYAYTVLFSIKKPVLLSSWYIEKYTKLRNLGLVYEYYTKIIKKPWYFCDAVEIYKWKLLKYGYLNEMGNYGESYDLLCSISEKDLYPNEIINLNIEKAYLLYQMGDYCKAESALSNNKYDEYTYVWVLRSIFAEACGDLEKAWLFLCNAKNNINNKLSDGRYNEEMTAIYNNYGRIMKIRENQPEAIHYYQLAVDSIIKAKSQINLHIPYQNLIFHKMIAAKGITDDIVKLRSDYEASITKQSLFNATELINFQIEYYRQINDKNMEFITIRDGYYKLISMSDSIKDENRVLRKCSCQASTFRMLVNGCYDISWFTKEIYESQELYFKLPIMIKNNILQEFYSAITQTSLKDREPYKSILYKIIEYYKNTALNEINEYIRSLNEYQVNDYTQIQKYRLNIMKNNSLLTYIDDTLGEYESIIKRLLETGHKFEALDMILQLVDECIAPANYYQLDDYGRLTGISLTYYLNNKLQVGSLQFGLKYRELMVQKLDQAIVIWKTITDHPEAIRVSLGIAYFLLVLGNKEESYKYFRIFKSSGITINHYAHWYRRFYNELNNEFYQ